MCFTCRSISCASVRGPCSFRMSWQSATEGGANGLLANTDVRSTAAAKGRCAPVTSSGLSIEPLGATEHMVRTCPRRAAAYPFTCQPQSPSARKALALSDSEVVTQGIEQDRAYPRARTCLDNQIFERTWRAAAENATRKRIVDICPRGMVLLELGASAPRCTLGAAWGVWCRL